MCSGVSGTIWGANGGNGGGIDKLILLRCCAGVRLLEELRFLGFGDSCGGGGVTLLRLRFAVFVVLLIVVEVVVSLLQLAVVAEALIMVGSGARGR